MAPTETNRRKDQLTDRVPRAAKRRIATGGTNADADTAVPGDNFEDDVEGGVGDWVLGVVGRLRDGDE